MISLVFVLAAVGIIAMLVKGASGRPSRLEAPRAQSALDILKERYARGAIGRDEFEQKKRDLH